MTNKLYKIMKQSYKRKAFTLIELIIVIAVIAILAGLALPRFLGVSKNANVSAMYGDIDALEKAITMYNVNSDDDSYPIEGDAIDLATLPGTLQDELSELGDSGSQLYEIDDTLLEKYIQRTKFNKDDYIYSMETGIVISKPGKVDSDDYTHHTNERGEKPFIEVADYSTNWKYTIDEYGKVTLTFYIGEVTSDLTIPNTLIMENGQKKRVVAVGSGQSPITGKIASSLKTVKISDGIKIIGSTAFAGCTNLTDVVFPENLKSIGSSAFGGVKKLNEVNLKNIDTIEKYAFSGNNIDKIVIDNCKTIRDTSFSGGAKKSIKITNTKNIEQSAFSNISNTESIDIKNVGTIEKNAFTGVNYTYSTPYSGEGLTINIDGVSYIASSAFSGCKEIIKMEVSNVDTIDENAFMGCKGKISDGVIQGELLKVTNVNEIKESAFNGITNIQSLYVENIKNVETYAFLSFGAEIDDMTKGIDVVVKNIETIGEGAFHSLSPINTMEVSDINSVGINAFANIKSPYGSQKTIIGEYIKIRNIGNVKDRGFGYLKNVSNLYIDNIDTIETNGFYAIENIANVEINDIDTIGNSAFSSSSAIDNLKIDKVNVIETNAFQNLGNSGNNVAIQNVEVNNVKEIKEQAFIYCKIDYLTLNNVTTLGNKALDRLTAKGVKLENVKNIGDSLFNYATIQEYIKFGDGTKSIGTDLFGTSNFQNFKTYNYFVIKGSKADEWCQDNGITPNYLDQNGNGVYDKYYIEKSIKDFDSNDYPVGENKLIFTDDSDVSQDYETSFMINNNGKEYNTVNIGSNGQITIGDLTNTNSWAPYFVSDTRYLFANGMSLDIPLDEGTTSGIFVKENSDNLIIEYRNVGYSSRRYTFSVQIYSNGIIKVYYKSGDYSNSRAIGLYEEINKSLISGGKVVEYNTQIKKEEVQI